MGGSLVIAQAYRKVLYTQVYAVSSPGGNVRTLLRRHSTSGQHDLGYELMIQAQIQDLINDSMQLTLI